MLQAALQLSTEERRPLADSLLNSVCPPDVAIEREWMEVIERRCDDLEHGRVKAIPGDEFMAELKRRYPGA
jgi:putative addiction module component (TIGR02574 family)